MRKLALILAWLIDDPEAYKGKTNTHIENEILKEAPTIPYVATIEKDTVLDISQTKTPNCKSQPAPSLTQPTCSPL